MPFDPPHPRWISSCKAIRNIIPPSMGPEKPVMSSPLEAASALSVLFLRRVELDANRLFPNQRRPCRSRRLSAIHEVHQSGCTAAASAPNATTHGSNPRTTWLLGLVRASSDIVSNHGLGPSGILSGKGRSVRIWAAHSDSNCGILGMRLSDSFGRATILDLNHLDFRGFITNPTILKPTVSRCPEMECAFIRLRGLSLSAKRSWPIGGLALLGSYFKPQSLAKPLTSTCF